MEWLYVHQMERWLRQMEKLWVDVLTERPWMSHRMVRLALDDQMEGSWLVHQVEWYSAAWHLVVHGMR